MLTRALERYIDVELDTCHNPLPLSFSLPKPKSACTRGPGATALVECAPRCHEVLSTMRYI
jgi:hypothetical protein